MYKTHAKHYKIVEIFTNLSEGYASCRRLKIIIYDTVAVRI